ncbi:relaxase/mobilization nuclease domain-containing protein [Dickeya fangzhongdai]|uniref:relaxase/mobilization nuclease domain-containing protein n=1 Tax=Dickeya fangzhongdai TaxID=1778540 RepID=UPI0026DF3456|nr:relaxase/mobilization nuclease domain-containing protein [Dickeya fangzhongdai]WKV52161.1 relaxase/mobilization nuclease domain-containing protein [Dickeya fangzhongdai]
MKGMQKIKRGKSFAGVVLYALKSGSHHNSDPVVIGGNMLSDSANELIAELDTSKQLRQDVQKPVWHNSLRLPVGESLTTDQWRTFADDYMARLGFSNTHLRCYVLHDDMAGQHIHIIASRIDVNGGKLYLGRNENLISTRIISELEIAHDLTVTRTAVSPGQPKKKKVSRNEQKMQERQGSPVPKEAVRKAIDTVLSTQPDINSFVSLLDVQGITALPNIASTGKMNGFSFEYDGIAFKASQLGKGYGWNQLQEKLSYQPERDNDYLLALKSNVVPDEQTAEVDAFMQLAMNPAEIPVTIIPETNGKQPASEPVEAISIGEAIEALSRKILSIKAQQQKRSKAQLPDAQSDNETKPSNQKNRLVFTFKPFKFIYAILHKLPSLRIIKIFDGFQAEPKPSKPLKIRM